MNYNTISDWHAACIEHWWLHLYDFKCRPQAFELELEFRMSDRIFRGMLNLGVSRMLTALGTAPATIARSTATLGVLVPVLALLCCPPSASAAPIVSLGTASTFAVLAGTTVTNSGSSIVNGDLGTWPGTAITGFGPGPGLLGPGIVNGTQYAGGSGTGVPGTAQNNLTTAYNNLAGLACGTTLTGQDLGGMTLTPGVYCFSSSAQLTGTLTLDEQGQTNPAFVFQIGSALVTSANSAVNEINGGTDDNIFWQVGSSASLGTATQFLGNIVALTSVSLAVGAQVACGSVLARNGAVTMLDNAITSSASSSCAADANAFVIDPASVPEPGTLALLAAGLAAVGAVRRRKLANP